MVGLKGSVYELAVTVGDLLRSGSLCCLSTCFQVERLYHVFVGCRRHQRTRRHRQLCASFREREAKMVLEKSVSKREYALLRPNGLRSRSDL